MTDRLRSLLIGMVITIGFAVPAAAQGNGNGRPKTPKTTTPAPAPAPAPASPFATSATTTTSTPIADALAPVITLRQFGSWLDDASAPTRGEGYTTIGVGHWRMSGVTQTNVPMLGAGLGLTDRVQVSASIPFYRVRYQDGSVAGVDDVYISAKYNILDPTVTLSEIGLAFSPAMEILSSSADGGRVHLALPVSLELRREAFRVYGSAGYFTRGAFFTGGAVEWTTPSRLVITGSFTQSYSMPQNELLDSLAVPRQRADVSASVAYPLGTRAGVYGSAGRSLSSVADGGTSLALSGGVTFRFSSTRSTP